MRFFCITQPFLTETNDVLRAACEARGIPYTEIYPGAFDYERSPRPLDGDALYRPATDIAACRLEQVLYHPGVAVLTGDPLFGCFNQLELFAKSGLPVPKTVQTANATPELLAAHVAYLGGFPVVLKVLGSEGGVGVIKVDSMESLVSVMDYMRDAPLLMEFFPHVAAYRLVVVGDRVVDVESRYPGDGDFRTNSGGSGTIGQVAVPEEAKRIAVQAAQVLGVAFGGADILHAETGEMVISELNSPCYFADQQNDYGADIAGAMVEHLVSLADGLNTRRASAGF